MIPIGYPKKYFRERTPWKSHSGISCGYWRLDILWVNIRTPCGNHWKISWETVGRSSINGYTEGETMVIYGLLIDNWWIKEIIRNMLPILEYGEENISWNIGIAPIDRNDSHVSGRMSHFSSFSTQSSPLVVGSNPSSFFEWKLYWKV